MSKMNDIRTALEAGKAVKAEDFDLKPVAFQGYIASLRSPKYCGTGRLPLNIVRDKETKAYSLYREAVAA
jgi:hypothetical protein